MNTLLSYFMPKQKSSQRDTKIKHNTSQNFKPQSQDSMIKRQSQILVSNQIIQKTDIIEDTRYNGLKKKKYCDSAQFFTLSSEIVDQDGESSILLLCTDGQYVGNLSGQRQKVLKANCHFAICQKKSKQPQKQPDLERIQKLKASTSGYVQKQQQLKSKHLEKNKHLYFLVFQLKFDMANDNPVQMIEKGHLFPILEYYASSNHKNNNQSFQLVINSLSKYLDLNLNTFQLPIVSSGHQEQNFEQTIYKFKFKDIQDFQSVVFFINKRLQDLFYVQQRKLSLAKQQRYLFLNGTQQDNDQMKGSEIKNHCMLESNQIMIDEANHFEIGNFSSQNSNQTTLNKAQDILIKINDRKNSLAQLRQSQKLEEQYQHAVLKNQNLIESNPKDKMQLTSQIDSVEEKQLNPIERHNNFIKNNEMMKVEMNNQDQMIHNLSQKKQNMETLINLPENHESMRQIEEVIQKKQCKQVVSYKKQYNISDQFNIQSAHNDRNQNKIDLIEAKDKEQLSAVISNHSMSEEKEDIQNQQDLSELKEKIQYTSQITTVNLASENLPQSNYLCGKNLQEHESFLPKKLDFKDEQVISKNNQEINEIEAMQDEDFENYKIDEQLEEKIQKGYESGDEMQKNRNQMKMQNYNKDHSEVNQNQVVKPYQFVQEPKDQKKKFIEQNGKKQQDMPQINFQILYSVVKRTETPNNENQSSCGTQINKTTYCLVRTPKTSILCLQILKEKCMTTEAQQSKKQPFKLILYNPLVLDSQNVYSNKLYHDSQFLTFVHNMNAFEINDVQTKILFYSTLQKSLPIVLEFDLKEEKFIQKYDIRNYTKFSLKQVKYFPEKKGFLFIAVNKFQILLVPQQMQNSLYKKDNRIRILTYRKNITQQENQWAQFQCFDIHLNGKHLVAGVDGRYVKIFDLKPVLKIQSFSSKGKQNLTASKQKTYESGVKKSRNIEQNKQLLMTSIPSKTKRIQKNHPTCQKISVSRLHEPHEFIFLKALNSYDLYNNQNIQASFSRSNFMYDFNSRISNIKIVYEKVNSQQISQKAQKILCSLENGDKFLIDCKELNERGEQINCFDNKLRIGNRSLIKQINNSKE